MNRPRAFLFDVFGTLVDWRTSITNQMRLEFEKRNLAQDAHAFAVAWRAAYDPAMAPIRSGKRGYVALDELHRENLVATLEAFDIEQHFTSDDISKLARAWEKLDPWPDTVAGLSLLKTIAPIAPCSNGSIALMTHLARHAHLPWDCILGADIGRNYKPHPDCYLASCDALRLPPEKVMMVAAHNSDLEAAREVGLQTAFIARPNEHADPAKQELVPTQDWTAVAADLGDLANPLSAQRMGGQL